MANIKFDSGRAPRPNQPNLYRGSLTVQPVGIGAVGTMRQAVSSVQENLNNTFRMFDQAANQVGQLGDSLFIADQQTKLTKAQTGLSNAIGQLQQSYQGRLDWDKMGEDFKKESSELTKQFGADLKGQFAEKFKQDVSLDVGKAYKSIQSRIRKGKVDQFKATLRDAAEYHSRQAAYSEGQEAVRHQNEYYQKLMSGVAAGVISQEDAVNRQIKFAEDVDYVKARKLTDDDPIKAMIALRDPKAYPNLDPRKRVELQERAVSSEKQRQSEEDRIQARAERLEEQRVKAMNSAVAANAVNGEVGLPELRDMLRTGKINSSGYNAARILLNDYAKGDIVTDQNKYADLYGKVVDGQITKDTILDMPDVAPQDKVSLINRLESTPKHQNTFAFKNAKKTLEGLIIPGGINAIHTSEDYQRFNQAVTELDRNVSKGMPVDEALSKVSREWGSGGKGPLPPVCRFGNLGRDATKNQVVIDNTISAFKSGTIDKETYVSELRKIKSYQKQIDAYEEAVLNVKGGR